MQGAFSSQDQMMFIEYRHFSHFGQQLLRNGRPGNDKEVVLAFAERRRGTSRDTGDIDMVMRRSEDGGASWSEEATICDL